MNRKRSLIRFSLHNLRDPDDEDPVVALVVRGARHSMAVIETETGAAKRFAIIEAFNVEKEKRDHGHDHATFGEEVFASNDFLECVSVAMSKSETK